MQLKGTTWILVAMIIQIVLNVIIFAWMPEVGALLLIDTVLIIGTYFGFKYGKRGWAIFAIAYSIISLLLAFSQGNFFNLAILILIAGIIGVNDKEAV